MHISWNFLDKRKATIKAIEAFDSMNFIISHSDEDIAEVRAKMEGVRSPGMDGMPHAHDPNAAEQRLGMSRRAARTTRRTVPSTI